MALKRRHPSNSKRRKAKPCHLCGITGTPKINGTRIGLRRLLCVPCYKRLHRRACEVARLPVFRGAAEVRR